MYSPPHKRASGPLKCIAERKRPMKTSLAHPSVRCSTRMVSACWIRSGRLRLLTALVERCCVWPRDVKRRLCSHHTRSRGASSLRALVLYRLRVRDPNQYRHMRGPPTRRGKWFAIQRVNVVIDRCWRSTENRHQPPSSSARVWTPQDAD
jgi:hypothetical protein